MKKFFLLIAIISISLTGMAQKGKVTSALGLIDQGALDKAKEALDQASENEKSKDWFTTYFAKGRLCQATFESENPEFKKYFAEPLQEAYSNYQKSMELDEKGTIKKRIITNMVYNSLAVDLYNQGSARFSENNYDGALLSFKTQIKVTESDMYVGSIDTGMYYNAGLAAINSNKFTEALDFFQKCADMKYQGISPYYQIYLSYLGLGDTTKAESVLMNLTTLFPNDKGITLQLIDLYIKSGKNDEALSYIKKAKEDDPSNSSLYFAAGIIYLNSNMFDDAISELNKSVELAPEPLYDTQYSLGAAYINKAADMFVKANEIMDVNKYSTAIDEANEVYAKALPYMEKAHELNPEDVYSMRSLQELYYRLRQKDPSLSPKYDAIKAKLDSIAN